MRQRYLISARCLLASIIVSTVFSLVTCWYILSQRLSDESFYEPSMSSVCREPSNGINILGRHICYNSSLRAISFFQFTNYSLLNYCAVTMAAVKNQNHGVCVLQSEAVTLDKKFFQRWLELGNIQVIMLDPRKLIQGTVIEEWYMESCRAPLKNKILTSQAANALRLLYTYKYGGIALDTDVMTLRPFPNFTNTLGLEDGFTFSINNAVMIFDKGNPFLAEAIEQFRHFTVANWHSSGGPRLMTNVYRKRIKKYGHIDSSQGILNIVPPSVFYPLRWNDNVPRPFLASYFYETAEKCQYSVTLHLYPSQFTKVVLNSELAEKGSFVHNLLHQHCV